RCVHLSHDNHATVEIGAEGCFALAFLAAADRANLVCIAHYFLLVRLLLAGPFFEEWLDFFHLARQVCVADAHWLYVFNAPVLRRCVDTSMQRDLGTVSKREFAFGRLTEQVIDELFAIVRMRSSFNRCE